MRRRRVRREEMGENGPYKYLGRINSGPWRFGQSGNRRWAHPDAHLEMMQGAVAGQNRSVGSGCVQDVVMCGVDWGTSADPSMRLVWTGASCNKLRCETDCIESASATSRSCAGQANLSTVRSQSIPSMVSACRGYQEECQITHGARSRGRAVV